MTPTPAPSPQIDAIVARATEITSSIAKLSASIDSVARIQTTQINRLRRVNFILAGVVAVSALSVGINFWQLEKVQSNTARIDVLQSLGGTAITNAVREQQARKNVVFCPLLEHALSTYDLKNPYAIANPERYQRNFGGLERAAEYMECLSRTRAGVSP